MEMSETKPTPIKRPVWNAGRTVGAKRALKPKQNWEIRFNHNQRCRLRDRALSIWRSIARFGAAIWCR